MEATHSEIGHAAEAPVEISTTTGLDSRKLGVWYQGRHHMVRIEPQLDYWDGED